MKKNVIDCLFIFGTRPEAIKLAPLINHLKGNPSFSVKVCVTAQHRQMLDQVLNFFGIIPDYDLDLMRPNQNLFELTGDIIKELNNVFEQYTPEYVLVHGDTTTSFASALASFYKKIKVCHVEAGLRTFDVYSPFPEEMNRQLTSKIATIHFSPTFQAKQNLLNEGINDSSIVVTGNTVIDALNDGLKLLSEDTNEQIAILKSKIDPNKKIILVTGHRRENFGDGFVNICNALKRLVIEFEDDIQVIYPVHLNPNVKDTVFDILSDMQNILLVEPLDYEPFIWLMSNCYVILTDSGGIQEEAPSLGKPVLVMRQETERPEAVSAGTVILVGTNEERIVQQVSSLIRFPELVEKMSKLHNPYGDGMASRRIEEFLLTGNCSQFATPV